MARYTVSPFRRGRVYWARIPAAEGRGVQRSLGTTEVATADQMCAFLSWCKARRERTLLEGFSDGTLDLGAAYEAWTDHRLDEFRAQAADHDLTLWLGKWEQELRRRGVASVDRYLRQLRTLMPEGRSFSVSALTKPAIREWLLTRPSPNRYRAALSGFCAFLVQMDVLPYNPVKGVARAKEHEPRQRYLGQDECIRLIEALSGEDRAYHALALATAMERQAMMALTRRDVAVDNRTILARGRKTKHRERTVTVYWRWEWAWRVFTDWLATQPFLPDARVFDRNPDAYYLALVEACKAVGLSDYRPHDHRHTWGVQAVRDGLNIQTVAHQLGHGTVAMTLAVYGRFIPTQADFTRATVGATVATEQPRQGVA